IRLTSLLSVKSGRKSSLPISNANAVTCQQRYFYFFFISKYLFLCVFYLFNLMLTEVLVGFECSNQVLRIYARRPNPKQQSLISRNKRRRSDVNYAAGSSTNRGKHNLVKSSYRSNRSPRFIEFCRIFSRYLPVSWVCGCR